MPIIREVIVRIAAGTALRIVAIAVAESAMMMSVIEIEIEIAGRFVESVAMIAETFVETFDLSDVTIALP
jgi:hypothetical protein